MSRYAGRMKAQIKQSVTGFLRGKSPNGKVLAIEHYGIPGVGFRIFHEGVWREQIRRTEFEESYGLTVRLKKKGVGKGDPQTTVLAVGWNYLVRQKKAGKSIEYSVNGDAWDDLLTHNVVVSTEFDQVTKARLGQGKFRDDVLKMWGNRCAVTGLRQFELIRASHIKPWRESKNDERLDPHNGIPLVASLDALFDRFLITFDDDGILQISGQVHDSVVKHLGLATASLRSPLGTKQLAYLRFHRKQFNTRR